jgi:PAS domain S-box-containing protein
VDHSIVGVSIADMRRPDQPLIYVNSAFTKITGYSWDLAVGYNSRFLQGPDSDPVEVQRIRDAIEAGLPYSGEILNYRLDGSRFWNRLMLSPVGASQDSSGGGSAVKPDFYVANQIDISSIRSKSSLFDDELAVLALQLHSAKAALDDTMRFGEALKARLAENSSGINLEEESLLKAQVQAQELLVEALEAMQAWVSDRRTSS